MEETLNYRGKLWIESLDMVNNNLIKMYSAHGEFEGVLNSIVQRQNDFIKKMALSMEWYVIISQIVLFCTLFITGFEHSLRNNQPN